MTVNRSMNTTSNPPRGDVDQAVDTLASLGTFANASRADLKAIVAAGRLVTVPARWSLIWDKTPADKAYVVLAGQVDVRRDNAVVARLGAGDVIGEVAILHRRLRSATVVAASPLSVLHFDRLEVERLHHEVPAFRVALDAAAAAHS
jgi:CRP/FNR family cyclic AMP-dependent transcriptional regulator